MASKDSTISVLMKLKDEFTRPMERVTKDVKTQERQFKSAQNQMKKWHGTATNAFASVAKKAILATAAIVGIGTAAASMKKFASESIEAAAAAQKVAAELENALSNVDALASGGKSAISAASADLQNLASEIQKTGVIGDDETLAGFSQLATMGMGVDSIKTLSTAMDDLLAHQYGFDVTAENAKSMATALGKAMNGSYTSLQKMGVIVSDTDKKLLDSLSGQERAAKLAEIIEGAVGGANKALAETDEGKIKQFSNLFGDMQENLGAPLLSAKASLATVATKLLPSMESVLSDIFNGISNGMKGASDWLDKNLSHVTGIFDAIKKGLNNANISTDQLKGAQELLSKVLDGVAYVLETTIPVALEVIFGLMEGINGIVTLMVESFKWIANHLEQLGEFFEKVVGTPSDGNYSHFSMEGNELGTPYFHGGLTKINERGGEIVNLPSGTQIIPHDVSARMAAGTNVSLSINIQGNVIGNQEYAEELGSYITNKVVMALGVV